MKYQYMPEGLSKVIANPEEFIIPECVDACKILWSKGISTLQCSNYENDTFWIEIIVSKLSDENRKILFENIAKNEHFYLTNYYHEAAFFVEKLPNASEELCKLAEVFVHQDSLSYYSTEEFLDNYKKTDGKLYVDEAGRIRSDYNPNLKDATLDEALSNEFYVLYDKEESKIFCDEVEAMFHENYKRALNANRDRLVKVFKQIKKD